jgi:hypothetical protein
MLETWPAVFGVQFTGGRWLSVAPSQAARGTFDRKELRVVDGVLGVSAVDAGPEKPAQCSNSELMLSRRRRFARDRLPQAATHLRTGPRRG